MTDARTQVLERLADAICAVDCPHPVRVAIDGVDGAGKTTMAEELVPFVEAHGRPVIRASIDSFHNARRVRYKRGPDSPEGYYRDSFNRVALAAQLLIPLGPLGLRDCVTAVFDHRTDRPVFLPLETAPDNAVLLFDGIFLHRPRLLHYWDITIFLDVPFETTVERAMARDRAEGAEAAGLRERYMRRYVAGQKLYFADAHPHDTAHIIVDNTNPSEPRVVRGLGE